MALTQAALTTDRNVSVTKPVVLHPGDRVAIVTPSAPAPANFPRRFERAVDFLRREFNFDPVVMPHARSADRWVSAPARLRAEDLMTAFADQTIRAVFATIGGNHSAEILEHLDFTVIAANPKVFMGFSDMTALHHGLLTEGHLVTFYGPMLMTQWGSPQPHHETVRRFRGLVMSATAFGELTPATQWTDERGDWESDDETRSFQPSTGHQVLRPGSGSGPSLAGALPTVRQLVGTRWEPIYAGRVLLIEPPAHYLPADAAHDLAHLRNAGLLGSLAALLVGRPYGMTAAQRDEFHTVVLEAAAGTGYPVVAGVDSGHTDPMLCFPIGVQVSVDTDAIRVDEPAVVGGR